MNPAAKMEIPDECIAIHAHSKGNTIDIQTCSRGFINDARSKVSRSSLGAHDSGEFGTEPRRQYIRWSAYLRGASIEFCSPPSVRP